MLLEFPCELVSAVLAGRWAASSSPFRPWLRGYWLRLGITFLTTTLVCEKAFTRHMYRKIQKTIS